MPCRRRRSTTATSGMRRAVASARREKQRRSRVGWLPTIDDGHPPERVANALNELLPAQPHPPRNVEAHLRVDRLRQEPEHVLIVLVEPGAGPLPWTEAL